jgi:hypothetical protein
MTREKLVTAKPGVTLDEAKKILHRYRIEKPPVVDERNQLRGLISVKDIEKAARYPNAAKGGPRATSDGSVPAGLPGRPGRVGPGAICLPAPPTTPRSRLSS